MRYLERNRFLQDQITTNPDSSLEGIVVIPCFKEEGILNSLDALKNCKFSFAIEVIVVVNHSEIADEPVKAYNKVSLQSVLDWAEQQNTENFKVYAIKAFDLPKKHAGVGLARKIGMDEAFSRIDRINKPELPIICFDADSSCSNNYIEEVVTFFKKHPKSPGCSIHYEHPIEGEGFESRIYDGIVYYELFLRFYNQGLRFAKYPFAFHTIGSSMAVRGNVYAKQGGMNRRKAGEDFYFLHKIMPLGNFGEVLSAKVIPSPRTSDRVPFGTGKAISKWMDEGKEEWFTYDPRTFLIIREVVAIIDASWDIATEKLKRMLQEIDAKSSDFLIKDGFLDEVNRAKSNATSKERYLGQFYSYFNGLKLLKLVHFIRDEVYPELEVTKACNDLLATLGVAEINDSKKLLDVYRDLDRIPYRA